MRGEKRGPGRVCGYLGGVPPLTCAFCSWAAPWGKRGWKMLHTLLRGMVLYFLKVGRVSTFRCAGEGGRGAGGGAGEGPEWWGAATENLFSEPLCRGRERTTALRGRVWWGRWWTSPWGCTTRWPRQPPITPRSHTSSSCGLPTGASTSSRHRESGWEPTQGPASCPLSPAPLRAAALPDGAATWTADLRGPAEGLLQPRPPTAHLARERLCPVSPGQPPSFEQRTPE